MKLYNHKNIDSLPWPTTEDGDTARRFLVPLIKQGAAQYVHNVQTQVLALTVDDLVLPVTVNDAEYDNSYVCSPYTQFITSIHETLAERSPSWRKKRIGALVGSLGLLLKWGALNKVVQVNNWLLPTNLYPPITAWQLEAITDYLQIFFREHAILFRSINPHYNEGLASDLQAIGYNLLPSRLVYLWNAIDESGIKSKARWILKQDFRRLAYGDYQVVAKHGLEMEAVPRITELYNKLNIQKHPLSNPQYSEEFVELMLREELLQVVALSDHSQIDAALGFFCRNGIMSAPLFGYDTEQPQETGLYRMLSAFLVMEARKRSLLLHQSAGADQFKKCRGAMATIEYSAVYDRHLSLRRRSCWSLLRSVLDQIVLPWLRKQG